MKPVAPLELLHDLLHRRSVTPEDAGCMERIAGELERFGFQSRRLDFGEVSNLWCWKGSGSPTLLFLGHTDVVPTGPEGEWTSPPFEPTERDGLLYGRGSADMKGSVAAMVCALQRFVTAHGEFDGTLGLLLTSDEEGPAINGIRRVVPALQADGVSLDYCVVGEPSSQERLGDTIRIGRRGSLNGRLKVRGTQGHAAYPELADNPIHRAAAALAELAAERWDAGLAEFPPTSFQLTHLEAGAGVYNVIPGELLALFNFRYCPAVTEAELRRRTGEILDRHELHYDLEWQLSGEPFFTDRSPLIEAVSGAVERHCGHRPEANTGGGTSDGRFVAPAGAAVVEIGPVNASIHKIDEHVRPADVETLARIYQTVAEEMLL